MRLREVAIKGFRFFSGQISIRLGDGLTVIQGPPGSGKTSVIRAIEYGLFGSTREVRSRLFRRIDLINDDSDEATVTLVLESEEHGTVTLERTLTRDGRESLKVRFASGELAGERAQEFIDDLVGVTLDEFASGLSTSYTDLYQLIYGPPATRDKIIDDLVGLSLLEALYRELAAREARGYLKALESELNRLRGRGDVTLLPILRERLESIGEEKRRLVNELEKLKGERRALEDKRDTISRERAMLKDLIEKRAVLRARLEQLGEAARMPAVTRSFVESYAAKLLEETASLLEELYMGDYSEKIRSLERSDFGAVANAVGSALEAMRKSAVRLEYEVDKARSEIERMEDDVRNYEEELAELEARIRELEPLRWRYESLVKKYGGIEDIGKRVSRLKVQLKALQLEREYASCLEKILEKVSEDLASGAKVSCPVCGREIEPSLLKSRAPEQPENYQESIKRFEEELRELENVEAELRRLEPSLNELNVLHERRRRVERSLEDRLSDLEDARGRVEELQSHMGIVAKRLASLETMHRRFVEYLRRYEAAELMEELAKVEVELKQRGYDEAEEEKLIEAIKAVDRRIARLEAEIEGYEKEELEVSRQVEKLSELLENLKEIEAKYERVKSLLDSIDKIRLALQRAQARLRERLSESLCAEASRIFSSINPYGLYDGIEVRVEMERRERGRYLLLVKRIDGGLVSFDARLSDGQKAMVALSLFLAAAKLRRHGLPILIMDEPAPTAGKEAVERLVQLAKDGLREFQVILATQSALSGEYLEGVAAYRIEGGQVHPAAPA